MKKGSLFVVGVVIVSFLVLTSAFAVMFLKYSRTGKIGDKQFLVTKAYLEGDKAMLYMDTVASQAYEQAAHEFALNAGFSDVVNCNIKNFNIINSDCDFSEDTLKQSFNKYLNQVFNHYSKNYEQTYIPFNIYDFYEQSDEIMGFAKHPVVVLIKNSAENVNCFPGLLQNFPVSGSYVIRDTWGSVEHADAIRINVINQDTAVVAVVDGEINLVGEQHGEEFIEIISGQYKFHYSHLDVSTAMIKGGSVDAGEPIGSTSDYIKFKAYRNNIAMNPLCALQRIGHSNPVQDYYYVKPHISFKPKYDIFEDFNLIMETAQEIITDCANDFDCIKNNHDNKKISPDLVLNVGDCEGNEIIEGDVVGFCVESQDEEKSIYVYKEVTTRTRNQKLGIDKETTTIQAVLTPLRFRFALDTSKDFEALDLSLPEPPQTKRRTPGKATPIPQEPSETSLIWPVEAPITSCFGYRENPEKPGETEWTGGVDFGVPEGTQVKAVADGVIYQTAKQTTGYGFNVVIKHTDKFYTRYSHLSKILVESGDKVKQGEVIALSGNTGRSTGAHLDFRVHMSSSLATAPEGNHDWAPFCFLPKSSGKYSSWCKEHQCKISFESLYSST